MLGIEVDYVVLGKFSQFFNLKKDHLDFINKDNAKISFKNMRSFE